MAAAWDHRDLAEELVSEAMVDALEHWPRCGVPAALALALVVLPPRLVPTAARATTFADLARAQSDARGNLVAALGVLALLIGGVVGFLNFRENQQQNLRTIGLSRATLEVTERGQVSERFSKAVDQLGDEMLDVRIGANLCARADRPRFCGAPPPDHGDSHSVLAGALALAAQVH